VRKLKQVQQKLKFNAHIRKKRWAHTFLHPARLQCASRDLESYQQQSLLIRQALAHRLERLQKFKPSLKFRATKAPPR